MSSTPLFVITQNGLAVASVATPTGPWIDIVAFSVGDAYGYIPQDTDPGLNGNLLYSGLPTTYQNMGDGTINIVCSLPPDAGPFDFGEVALYLPGNVLFAKAVFTSLQTKYSSLGTNLLSTYTFNCLLKLQQSEAVFQVSTATSPPTLWDATLWSDVYPSGISANPDIPAILVHEPTALLGNASLLIKENDTVWTVASGYSYYNQAAVVNGTLNSVQVLASALTPSVLTNTSNKYIVEIGGYFRSVNNITVQGANYSFALNPANLQNNPTIGSTITIYVESESSFFTPITQPQFDATTYNAATDAFVQRALGNLSGAAPIAGNIILTAASAGSLQTFTATATAELPLGSTLVPGVCVFFRALSDNNVIAVQGTDQIYIDGSLATIMPLLLNDTCGLCWDGAHWMQLTGVASILNSKSFINSYNALAAQILTPMANQGATRVSGAGNIVASSGYEVYQLGNQFQVRQYQTLTNCNCNCACACTCVF